MRDLEILCVPARERERGAPSATAFASRARSERRAPRRAAAKRPRPRAPSSRALRDALYRASSQLEEAASQAQNRARRARDASKPTIAAALARARSARDAVHADRPQDASARERRARARAAAVDALDERLAPLAGEIERTRERRAEAAAALAQSRAATRSDVHAAACTSKRRPPSTRPRRSRASSADADARAPKPNGSKAKSARARERRASDEIAAGGEAAPARRAAPATRDRRGRRCSKRAPAPSDAERAATVAQDGSGGARSPNSATHSVEVTCGRVAPAHDRRARNVARRPRAGNAGDRRGVAAQGAARHRGHRLESDHHRRALRARDGRRVRRAPLEHRDEDVGGCGARASSFSIARGRPRDVPAARHAGESRGPPYRRCSRRPSRA